MDKYTKTLEIVTKVSDAQYQKFRIEFKKDRAWLAALNEKSANAMIKNYAEANKKLKQMEQLKQVISDIELFGDKDAKKQLRGLKKELNNLEAPLKWKKLKEDMTESISDGIKNAGKEVAKFITDTFKDAIAELKNMSSYNYGTSLFQNSNSRQSALTYGLNSSNAYGLDKAMAFMNISSLEDTFMFNKNQQELFADLIGRYTDKYNSLNNSGFFEKWDQFTVQFKLFKEDVMYDMMDFIMDNRDTIKAGFNAGITLMKSMLVILGKIGAILGTDRSQYEKDMATSNIISNYTKSSKSLTINNSFNGVQTANRTELINAGELTYAQVKQVLYSE